MSDNPPSVSAIICTLGRTEPLRACLEALRQQTLRPDETIVVLGPCETAAEEFLATQAHIRLGRTPLANLCVSRNLGVRSARGEVVAFCDDDAVPQPEWLEHLVAPFRDARVGGSGGRVDDARHAPPTVAFQNGIVRLSGRQVRVRAEPGDYNNPRGPWSNCVCGCSCAFRRAALDAIGGFDEFIEFAYDEVDVCLRLIRAGYAIAHAPRAVVLHALAAGGHRQDDLVRDWRCEIKNQLYVGLKNRRGMGTALRTLARVAARALALGRRFRAAAREGRITRAQAKQFRRQVRRGMAEGLKAGFAKRAAPR